MERRESAARKGSREGKSGGSRAAAGLTEGTEQTSLREAMRRRCLAKTATGGRHDSAERMGVGVVRKQFVVQRWTCRQKTSMRERRPAVGTKKSAPYRRMGESRDTARRWARWGGTPVPGGESLRIVEKAPCARERRLAKWAEEERSSESQ
jgi:hypothetical protein